MDETAVGGAELVTLRMFEALDRQVVRPHLVCLRTAGPLAEDFGAAGVGVVVLRRTSPTDPRRVIFLAQALRRSGTDAVLVAHHHRAALVVVRLAALVAGVRAVIVAAHDMDLVPLGGRVLPRSTVATLRGVSALVLLAPSQRQYLHRYEGVGKRPWSRTREVVIPNGIPMPAPPTAQSRLLAREILGLPLDAFVVGIVARLSAQKAHHVLLTDVVEFPGRVSDEFVQRCLSTADVCLSPDPKNPLNDVSTMNKVVEYMAMGRPLVSFDLVEARVSAGEAAIYVPDDDEAGFARAVDDLLERPEVREQMGNIGRERVEQELSWLESRRRLVGFYDRLLATP